MRFIAIMFAVFLACNEPPLSTSQTNNRNFKVEFLFEHDGCKVYRFEDARSVYFTNCGDTRSDYVCGKGCIRQTQCLQMKDEE